MYYIVTANRFKYHNGFMSSFEQRFKCPAEARAMYFKLLPDFSDVQLTGPHGENVTIND